MDRLILQQDLKQKIIDITSHNTEMSCKCIDTFYSWNFKNDQTGMFLHNGCFRHIRSARSCPRWRQRSRVSQHGDLLLGHWEFWCRCRWSRAHWLQSERPSWCWEPARSSWSRTWDYSGNEHSMSIMRSSGSSQKVSIKKVKLTELK